MKIAILGASSFLAQVIVAELSQLPSVHLERFHRNANSESEYNIPDKVISEKHLIKYDAIIYCAASGVQSNNKVSSSSLYAVNLNEPRRIINTLIESRSPTKFISFGSYFEIGQSKEQLPYTEDMLVSHSNPMPNDYCLTKHLFTKFISDKIHSGNFLHFVLPTIYGKGENPHRLIPYICRELSNGNQLALTSGQQSRMYIHAKDVAAKLSQVIQTEISGIYNLAALDTITIKSLVEKVAEIGGFNAKFQFGASMREDQSMAYLSLNGQKSRQALNWHPKISLESGIKEYL